MFENSIYPSPDIIKLLKAIEQGKHDKVLAYLREMEDVKNVLNTLYTVKIDRKSCLLSPLMLAAFYHHPAITSLLLRWGADVNLANSRGESTFSFCFNPTKDSISNDLENLRILFSYKPRDESHLNAYEKLLSLTFKSVVSDSESMPFLKQLLLEFLIENVYRDLIELVEIGEKASDIKEYLENAFSIESRKNPKVVLCDHKISGRTLLERPALFADLKTAFQEAEPSVRDLLLEHLQISPQTFTPYVLTAWQSFNNRAPNNGGRPTNSDSLFFRADTPSRQERPLNILTALAVPEAEQATAGALPEENRLIDSQPPRKKQRT